MSVVHKFCKAFKFERMGAFVYSEDDGTPAADFTEQVTFTTNFISQIDRFYCPVYYLCLLYTRRACDVSKEHCIRF